MSTLRPRNPTREMQAIAAKKIADELIKWGDFEEDDYAGIIDDILKVGPRCHHQNGYELAKALDTRCGWSPDASVVEVLDGFWSFCHDEVRAAEKQWALENPMVAPFTVGTTVDTGGHGVGKIEAISSHTPAAYEIAIPGQSGRLIICFENTKLAE